MNASNLMTRLKRNLGITFFSLPFEDPDKEFMEIIKDTTLPVFSQFYPATEVHYIDLTKVKKSFSTYSETCITIPESIIQGRRIRYMIECEPYNTTLRNNYYPLDTAINNTPEFFEDMMLGQVGYDLMSSVTPIFTSNFVRPNKLFLYNLSASSPILKITIGVDHSPNLATIIEEETFMELAECDIKRFLYANLKHMDKIETSYGTVDLHIEDWSSAEQDRREIINRFKQDFHLRFPCIKYA